MEISMQERELIIMALAYLSLAKPGFERDLVEIAKKIDDTHDGRPKIFYSFRAIQMDKWERIMTS